MVYQRRRCISNPRRFKNVGQETLGCDIVYKLVGFSVRPEVKQIYIITSPIKYDVLFSLDILLCISSKFEINRSRSARGRVFGR